MEGHIKKVRITGGAADTFLKEATKTRKRVLRGVLPRAAQEGGGAVAVASSAAPIIQTAAPAIVAAPVVAPVAAPVATPVALVQHAGAKAVKVILDPSKKKPKNIVLSPPKTVVKLPGSAPVPDGKKRNVKTHKIARRIRVSVDGLKKRVHRAKTIKKESQKMSIDQLKKDLQSAGLIKEGSKAPEHILRQMYSDFQVLKQRAL